MKFFYGEIKINNYEFSKYDISKKYSEFYKCNYNREISNIENSFIRYYELGDKRYDENLDGSIFVFGDIQLLLLNDEIIELEEANQKIRELYQKYGLDFVKYIQGQFSIILIDTKKTKVHLIKDQIGTKPIYYLKNNDKIIFSSDLFLINEFIERNFKSLNDEYFKEYYFCMGNVNSENTPYKDIYKVENGSIVSLDYKDYKKNKINYWDLSKINKRIDNDEEKIIEEFKKILANSLRNKISNDKKLGVMMSGGLDSTSIYGVIKGILQKKATVVTGVYNELKLCDERKYSNQVIEKYLDEVIEVECDKYGLFYGYPEDDYLTYEPHVNALSLKLTEELIKQASNTKVDILLDGYAADHILGGTLSGYVNDFKKFKIRNMIQAIKSYSLQTNSGVLHNFNEFILGPIINRNVPRLDDKINNFYKNRFRHINDYNKLEFLIQLNSANAYLYADRIIAPRYNIELNHPFLDKQIIEFLYCIDHKYRLNEKYNKYILREAMKDILPNEVRTRITKTENVSLSYKGIVEKWNDIYFRASKFHIREFGFVDLNKEQWIEQLYKYRSGQVVREDFLVILTLELWLEKFKQRIN